MPTIIRLAVARHGTRADDDPLWARSDPSARLWDPPLSETGREQALSLGDFAASLGVSRLVVSPFTRCLQTAAAVARKILEKAAEEELKEEKEKAAEATAANANGGASRHLRRRPPPPPSPLVVEIDVSVCEVLSRDCMGGRDPPDGADPGLWAWGGAMENGKGGSESEEGGFLERRLLSAAAAAGLPPGLTSLVSCSKNKFASYPETRGEAGTRYLIALASAAARALAAGAGGRKAGAEEEEEEEENDDDKRENNPNEKEKEKDTKQGSESSTATPTTMVVTHGEAVVAATRMTAEKGKPYAVPPTGVVVLDVFVEEECGGDNGNSSALAAAASAVACARWELSEAARGVAFE